MIFRVIIFMLFCLNFSNSYITNSINLNKVNNKNKIFLKPQMTICPDYLSKFTNLLDTDKSEAIVKGTTNFLTKVDGVGGYILHTNDIIINCILNNDIINMETKKSLILQLIHISQVGDSTGHQILQFYYDLVSCLL